MAQVKGTLWFDTNIQDTALKTAQRIRQQLEQEFAKQIDVKVNVQGLNELGSNSGAVKSKIDELTSSMTGHKSVVAELTQLYEQLNKQVAQFANNSKIGMNAAQQTNRASRESVQIERERTSVYARLNSNMKASVGISGQLNDSIAGLYSVYKAKEFLENVIAIGGQLEQQRVSIAAILHNSSHADELFGKIKSLALQSPFGVLDLDKYTKQLSAYGFQYNELFDMTKRLADISAGAGTDISRLALALGHVRSATYLTGITLRQFSMNNIPMLKMLSEYYTELEGRIVSTADVQKKVFNREVGYEAVINVIKRMTDEGGQFYNMQAVMADTLAGKWKNLKDAIDLMYGEIGESGVGDALKSVAEILTELTKRWKEMIPVIEAAAIAFGTWRLAMFASNAHITSFVRGLAFLNGSLKTLRASLAATTPYLGIFAALTVTIEALQHYRSQIEMAEKAADAAFKKGEEGIKNLNKAINGLEDPAKKMSNDAYIQGIQNIEQYLKDYSVRASEIINRANRVDENGDHVLTLAERYKYLYEQMKVTLRVYEEMKKTADAPKTAMEATGGWTNGWLDDNVVKNLNQYSKARKEWSNEIEKYYADNKKFVQEYIDNARQEDAAFANTTKGMHNYADMLKLLIQRQDDFANAYAGIRDRMAEYSFAWSGVNREFSKAKSDVDTWVESMKKSLTADWSTETDKDPLNNLSQERMDVIRNHIRDFLNSEELAGLTDFDRKYFNRYIHSQFQIDVVTNTNEAEAQLVGWQLEMQKYFQEHGIAIPVGPEDTPETIAKKAKELRDRYQTEINNSGKVLISLGFKLDKLPTDKPGDLAPWGGMNFDRYNEDTKSLKALEEGIKHFNLTVDKENKKNKTGGSSGGAKKDSVLEQWQLRVDALKSFYAEWNSLRKELGKTGAYNEIFKSGIMPDMFKPDGTPKYNLDNYAEELGRMNDALAANTDARKKAKQNLKKEQFKEVTDRARQAAEEAMAELQNTIEQTTSKWDLYKEISNKTGNKENAMQLVFGNTANLRNGIDSAKEYWKSMLEGVAQGISPDDLNRMSDSALADKFGENWKTVKTYRDEYMKAFRASADEEEKIYLELLEASMTFADKMAKIESQRKRDISAAGGDRNLIYAANQKASKAISELDFEKLKNSINWDVVFGNLETYTKDVLVKVRKQLKEYLKLNRKNMDVKQIKTVSEAVNKLNNAIANQAGLFGGVKEATEELTDAQNNLYDAQIALTFAREWYGEESQQAADAQQRLNEATDEFENAGQGVNHAWGVAFDKIVAISNAVAPIGKNAEASLTEVGNAIGGVVTALSKSGSKAGSIIAAIFSLLDSLGERGIGNFASNIVGSVGNALIGLNEWNPFNHIFSDHTFLGQFFGAELLRPADYRDYNEALAQYKNLIGVWDILIDRKNDYLSKSWGAEANRAAKEAREILQAQIEATKVIASERLGAGTSAGSHSIGYRMWEGSYDYNGQNWQDVAKEAVKGMKAAGLGDVVFESMEDMTRMTSKQLEYLMTNYSGLWAMMDGDFKEYLEKLIEYYDKAEEQTDQLKEKLTGFTGTSLADAWAGTISDMSKKSEDLYNNLEEGLRGAIINAMVSNLYGERIKQLVDGLTADAQDEWYTNTAGEIRKHTYDSNGNVTDSDIASELTDAEYAARKAEAEALTSQIENVRDMLAEKFGWTDESSATSSASQVLSGLSESDQGLFMSYVNAIRADASISRSLLERITVEVETMPTVWQNIADQTTLLRNIEANTSRNADSTGAIERLLTRMENGEFSVRVK